MDVLRRIVMTLGGITVIALVAALAAPKATHGIVATFVQVVNTAANPVPNRDVNNPGNQPFWAQIGIGPAVPYSVTVPNTTNMGQAVIRLVIQEVDGTCSVGDAGSLSRLTLTTVANGVLTQHILVFPASHVAGTSANWTQNTQIYADPGTSIAISADPSATQVQCPAVNITGYLTE
jgi:hypothetical protein